VNYTITWRIISKCRPTNANSNRCNLCLTEKFFIIYHPKMATLNTRNELASSCKHLKKFLLSNFSPG
jgi:hypothetical protein